MSKIIVTSNAKGVNVDFGIYHNHPLVSSKTAIFNKNGLLSVKLSEDGSYVRVYMLGESAAFPISYIDTENAMTVESINGLAPTSNEDLMSKIFAILS